VWEQEGPEAYHRYEYAGTYYVSLHVMDSRGNWRNGEGDCKVKITVRDEAEVLGIADTLILPKTGSPAFVGFGIVSLSSFGLYLYRRFRLV